jgi:hypothetical protein
LDHERRGRADTGYRTHPGGDLRRAGHSAPSRVEDQDVGVRGDQPVLDAVLESGHHGQDHDEGGDAQEDPSHAYPDEEREVGALAARAEIAKGQEELER